jgi:hypothetical protein
MQVENTKLDGVKLIKPSIFDDFRGHEETLLIWVVESSTQFGNSLRR